MTRVALRLTALALIALSQGACSLLNARELQAVEQLEDWHAAASAYRKAGAPACRTEYRDAREQVNGAIDAIVKESDDKAPKWFGRVDLGAKRLLPEPHGSVDRFHGCADKKLPKSLRRKMRKGAEPEDRQRTTRLITEMNAETRDDAAYQLRRSLEPLRWPALAGAKKQ